MRLILGVGEGFDDGIAVMPRDEETECGNTWISGVFNDFDRTELLTIWHPPERESRWPSEGDADLKPPVSAPLRDKRPWPPGV